MLPYISYTKNCYKKKNFIQSQKMPKKLKYFSLKIDKGAGIEKKRKTFLNKGIKHKKLISKV